MFPEFVPPPEVIELQQVAIRDETEDRKDNHIDEEDSPPKVSL